MRYIDIGVNLFSRSFPEPERTLEEAGAAGVYCILTGSDGEENEKIAEQAKDIISDANRSAEAIVREAREEGQTLKNELIEEGKKQSAQLLENAKKEMEQQRTRMLEEMHSELVDTAISAAEKVIGDQIDADADKKSIDSFIREVISK